MSKRIAGLFALVLVVGAAWASTASAQPPVSAGPPVNPGVVSGPVQVVPTHRINISDLPTQAQLALSHGQEVGQRPDAPGRGLSSRKSVRHKLGCGACIVSCWGATWRNGGSDWTGHFYTYQYDNWCGNGSYVTYASSNQAYDTGGTYSMQYTYGSYFSGGCAGPGCGSIQATSGLGWYWYLPGSIGTFQSTGKVNLSVTMYAYGGSSA